MIKKKRTDKKRHLSLYLGLIVNIVVGLAVAVLIYLSLTVVTNQYINNEYLSKENQQKRRDEYLADLQSFVTARKLTFEDADRISEWTRSHKYVYLLVQKDGMLLYPSDPEVEDKEDEEGVEEENPDGKENEGGEAGDGAPDEGGEGTGVEEENPDGEKNDSESNADSDNNDFSDVLGSLTENRPSREELIASAQANGLHEIELVDGTLMVALTEYTQTLYIELSRLLNLFIAALALSIIIINYLRIIINRIKRLENDVSIVSHENMNHQIVCRGRDEITSLSSNVEIMRNTMLENLKNEQEAREANTELITSISHDLRTPLTVLMGYVEMMKNHGGTDEEMQKYISATENTAQRLKQLSDDMLRYSLAFGDAKKSITLEEYDAQTLMGQLFSEHILLMEEQGYSFKISTDGHPLKENSTVHTDAQNLMRIVDNVFSNLHKYADKGEPIELNYYHEDGIFAVEFKNKIRNDGEIPESNGIGLKTCVRLASLIAESFEYEKTEDSFACRLAIRVNESKNQRSR